MRIALISIAENLSDPLALAASGGLPDRRRGLLQFAGRSLAARQIELALTMNCERIICLTRGIPGGHLELQQISETGGAALHLVESLTQLSGLVRAADDLFVFAEGALLPGEAVSSLDERAGVLAVSAEKGVPAGFERLDAELAWAGALRGSGSAMERLAHMASDVEPISALLRIVLQSGTRVVRLPDTMMDEGALAIFESEAQVDHAQQNWLRRTIQPRSWFAPGLALTDRVVARFAARLFAIDGRRGWSAALALALVAIALVSTIFTGPVIAYLVLAASAFAGAIAALLKRLTGTGNSPQQSRITTVLRWSADLAIIAVPIVAALPQFLRDGGFAMLVMVGLLLVSASRFRSPRFAVFGDRIVLCILLAVAAGFDWLVPVTQAVSLLVLLFLLVVSGKSQR